MELLTNYLTGLRLYLVMTVTAQSTLSLPGHGLTDKEREIYILINRLRKERGNSARITQQEIADRVGMDKSMLSRYLRSLRIIGVLGRDESGATTIVLKKLRVRSA